MANSGPPRVSRWRGPEGGCWPTREQELLLKAALLSGPEALDAWGEWQRVADIEKTDEGSIGILPLLYENLRRHGAATPLLPRLRGVYRHTWYRNQLHDHRVKGVLRSMEGAGIRTLLLKGMALSHVHYGNLGTRPMRDGDLLVPFPDAPSACDVLRRTGWTPLFEPLERERVCRASAPFVDSSGQELDLHWHVLHEDLRADADADFWAGAVPFRLGDVDTLVLDPADQLLHVLVHGIAWSKVPSIRWAADAVMIVRSTGGRIDWRRLIDSAVTRRLSCTVRDGLDYVHRTFGSEIPGWVVAELRSRVPSVGERLENRFRVDMGPGALWGETPSLAFKYVRASRGRGRRPTVRGFVDFLGAYWRVDATRLPAKIVRKLVRRTLWTLTSTGERMVRSFARRRSASPVSSRS